MNVPLRNASQVTAWIRLMLLVAAGAAFAAMAIR